MMSRASIILMILGCFGVAQSQFRAITDGEVDRRMLQRGTDEDSKKSPLLGIALSLLVPGTGEWYADNFSTGQYFMAADGVLWLGYAGLSLKGSWIRQDARSFAILHAGANMNGKDEQFDVDIGNFLTTDDYNQAKLRNREYDLLYERPDYAWSWDTDANRITYRTLRIRSDQFAQDSRFVVGALVLNRLISAFSAWRSVNRYNKAPRALEGWDIRAEVQGGLEGSHGLAVRFSKTF